MPRPIGSERHAEPLAMEVVGFRRTALANPQTVYDSWHIERIRTSPPRAPSCERDDETRTGDPPVSSKSVIERAGPLSGDGIGVASPEPRSWMTVTSAAAGGASHDTAMVDQG